MLNAEDFHLFNEGSHLHVYDALGAHVTAQGGEDGVHFAVWAPDAEQVWVIGDFNGWDKTRHPLKPQAESGVWAGFVAGAGYGDVYKYHIASRYDGYRVDKADPVGFCHERPPRSGSLVWDLTYDWNDGVWMQQRAQRQGRDVPMSIYEVHLGSWRREESDDDAPVSYRDLAPELADYAQRMGFTHVELLPVMEHTCDASGGYQTTGYYAPTSRYGAPQDFMYLIDVMHQHGIGVILDWVPSHFAGDEHGLGYFDGAYLYEHADARQGAHPDGESLIFNYGRHEVRAFLLSSAVFWLDSYHADGLRLGAVSPMLYLDDGRGDGGWIPNPQGGRDNLDAIDFLRRLNQELRRLYPDAVTFAAASAGEPRLTQPIDDGGLGFDCQWDVSWRRDTLSYLQREPEHRYAHQHELTYRRSGAASGNYTLPLSHDTNSLLAQMPGDEWRKFATLRLLLGYLYAQTGNKLLFMGGEFGAWSDWSPERSLDWDLVERDNHAGVQRWVRDLNALYRQTPALRASDGHAGGFRWVDGQYASSGVLSFLRLASDAADCVLAAFNFTPEPRPNYLVGAPARGEWTVIANSDATRYGGSGVGPSDSLRTNPIPSHGYFQTLTLTLPPLGVLWLQPVAGQDGLRLYLPPGP